MAKILNDFYLMAKTLNDFCACCNAHSHQDCQNVNSVEEMRQSLCKYSTCIVCARKGHPAYECTVNSLIATTSRKRPPPVNDHFVNNHFVSQLNTVSRALS